MDLKAIREKMNLTQAEFAARLGVSHGYVGHLETGHRRPSLKLAARIEQMSGARGLVDSVVAEKTGQAA